jgi:hypothetical protein
MQVHNLFFSDSSAEYAPGVLAAMTTVAKEFQGQMLFVNVPATETRVMDYFGIKADGLPTLVTVDMSGAYVHDASLTWIHIIINNI